MLKKSLLAAAAVIVVYSDGAFASNEAEEIAALKQKERSAQAQISALQAKIKALEAEKKKAEADKKVAEQAAARAQITELPATARPVALLPTWTGLYFGAGFSRSQTKIDQGTATQFATDPPDEVTDLLPLEKNIFNNGGHLLAGYRVQSGSWIGGLEGDYTFNDRANLGPGLWGPEGGSCGVAFTGSFVCGTVTPFGQFETLGHVRAVLGYEFSPRFMGYIAAGLAIGRTSGLGAHAGFGMASSPDQPIFRSVNSGSTDKYLFGYSVGFGVETKTSDNVSARFEYIRDAYSGVQTSGAVADGTLGGQTVTMTIPGGKAKIVNEAVRAALIYRLDADGSFGQNREWWRRFTTDPGLTDGSWNGFYAGGGLSQHNYTITDRQANRTISINDNTQPGVEYSDQFQPSLSDANSAYHLLFGYRAQWNRFVGGVEFNYEMDAGKQFFTGFKSPGQFGGINTSPGMNCYEQFLPQIVCVGGNMQGRIHIESKKQIRLTGGVLITPDILAYGVYGWAWGKSPDQIGASAAGIVTNPGDTPLVGAATVTRSGIQSKLKGYTIGGGLEVRANEWLSFRGEYAVERYNWSHLPVGGAGFGGTIGNVTVNSFIGASNEHKITNETYKFSAIVKLGNLPSILPPVPAP